MGFTSSVLTHGISPETITRWRRFRALRRAWYSLLLLGGLYILSLFSEWICNPAPLIMRVAGHWYFPVLIFYPEDTFLHNGRTTRPDYKALVRRPGFLNPSHDLVLFPPIPFGPLETLDPAAIPLRERVILDISPSPRIATLTIAPNHHILRVADGESFGLQPPPADPIDTLWSIPPELEEAFAARWGNHPAPALHLPLRSLDHQRPDVEVTLPAYTPRASVPASIRFLISEQGTLPRHAGQVTFDREMTPVAIHWPAWSTLPDDQRAQLVEQAREVLRTGIPQESLLVAGPLRYQAKASPNEVRWPYPPVAGHWMGIDSAGRDVLARLLYGLRTSLTFGFILVLVTMVIGTLIGALQGYFGKALDLAGQRLIEVWSAIPFLYVMILLGSVYGCSFTLLLICYALFNWIGISYYMRAEFLRLRHLPFVDAARTAGLPDRAIIVRHILPNALTPLITFFPFYLVGAVGSLAALDYLGFGLPPPTPSWGELLSQAQQFRWAWWLIVYPAGALFLVMLLGILVGEGLRNAFDPRPSLKYE